tara:strand:+ start:338 stop:718 length:381 start_codon:yes stop_codon:yes gene_type:complete
MYTEKQIITDLRNLLNPSAKFYIKDNGDLTMSLDGDFVDHTWAAGTFIPDGTASSAAKETAHVAKAINDNTITAKEKANSVKFYNRLFVGQLEGQIEAVENGDIPTRALVKNLKKIAQDITGLNQL